MVNTKDIAAEIRNIYTRKAVQESGLALVALDALAYRLASLFVISNPSFDEIQFRWDCGIRGDT